MTVAAQTGTTIAFLIMSGVIAFLAFRLYETRDQVRVLSREVAALLAAANQPTESQP